MKRKKTKSNFSLRRGKKELEQLKSKYKKGLLKFDSKELAESILKEFKTNLTKK